MLTLNRKINEENLLNSPFKVPSDSYRSSIYQFFVRNFIINRLIFNYRWFHLTFSSLTLSLLVIRTITFILEITKNLNSSEFAISIFLVFTISECWCLYVVLESIGFPSTSFVRNFDSIWGQLRCSYDENVYKQLVRSTFSANIQTGIVEVTNLASVAANSYIEYFDEKRDNIMIFIGGKLIDTFISLLTFNLLRGFFIAHNFIKIGHQHVNNQMKMIIESPHVPDSTLYRLRYEHFQLVRCGELCDLAYRRFVTMSCLVVVPSSIVILYNLAYVDLTISSQVVYFVILLQNFNFFVFFSIHLIGFYSHPGRVRDDIYQSTLIERSDSYKSEVRKSIDLHLKIFKCSFQLFSSFP